MSKILNLLEEVKYSFKELTSVTLTNIFITCQLVVLRIIEVKGDNMYLFSHKSGQCVTLHPFVIVL